MVDRERHGALHDPGYAGERNLFAGIGRHIQTGQGLWPGFELGGNFQYHAILVGLREDGGNKALPERVVQHVVDTRHRDAQAAGGSAVYLHIGLQAFVLQITGHIHQLRQGAQAFQQGNRGGIEFAVAWAGHQKLVLRFGDAVFNAQVLHRLQIELNAGHFAGRFKDAAHHFGNIARFGIAFGFGFQVDQHAPGVQRGIGPIHPDEAGEALHRWVSQDNFCQGLLMLGHGSKRGSLRGLGDALDGTRVLQGKEALGHHKIKPCRQRYGDGKDQQGDGLAVQYPGQHLAVTCNGCIKKMPGGAVQPAVAGLWCVFEQAGAQHGCERERHHGADQDGHRHRDGEFMEQTAHHIAHEQKRDQHRDQ